MKKIVGWIVRGGDQTRNALTRQDESIADLQRKVEALVGTSDELRNLAAPAGALPEQLREVTTDLGDRVAALNLRVEAIEQRLADLDAAIDRIVADRGTSSG